MFVHSNLSVDAGLLEFRLNTDMIVIPTFFEEKRGLCVTVRRPSAGPSVRQQFTSISSYTIDARITKLICMIPLCNTRGKKITCPGAQDKLNFRQDKHIFSPNVLWTSKKFTDSLFVLGKDK